MEIPAITFPILGEDFVLDFLPYFTLFGWKIYWYGVIIALGFILAVWYTTKRAPKFGLTEDNLIDTLIWAVPLAIVGARLYYVLFYREDGGNPYFDGVNDLVEIVSIWRGGLAIYGGVIGGILGVVISSRINKVSTRATADLCGLGLMIGQSIGRWGNFTNREAFGGDTDLPWRMGLRYSYGTYYHHPTFLYESLWNAVGFVILHFWSRKRRKFDGQLFLLYLGWYGLGRCLIEGLRTDSLYVGSTNLRVSQLLAGLTCLIALGIVLYVLLFRHPEPEELWVNRDRKQALLEAERAAEARRQEEARNQHFDEELSDAFRILRTGADPEGMTGEPVVEPVDFREAPQEESDEAAPAGETETQHTDDIETE